MRLLRNIGVPATLFLLFLLLGVYQPWLWVPPEPGSQTVSGLAAHRLFLVCLWLVGASLAHQVLVAVLMEGVMHRALGRPVPNLFKDILGLVIFAVATVCVIRLVFNLPLTGFWAMSGVLGIILGFALRPIILDFFSGLGANLEEAFAIGDWISLENSHGSYRGWIDEINWRTMRIRTRDGNILMLPNSRLATSVITNYRVPQSVSRFGIRVKLDLDTPAERALRVLNSAANAACSRPRGPRKEPAPGVLITDASEAGVEYWIRFWLDPAKESQDEVTHTVYQCVLEHLDKAGLSFAHPRENVFLARLPRAAIGFKSVDERLRFLRKIDLFADFSQDNLRYLAGEVRLRQVPRHCCLVQAGEQGESMFVLAEGMLSVQRQGPRDGETNEVAVLSPGDFFGEGSLLTGEPRSATVVASTECVLFEIGKGSLAPLLEQQPELLDGLSRTMAARRTSNRLADHFGRNEESGPGPGRTQVILNRMKQFFRIGGSGRSAEAQGLN